MTGATVAFWVVAVVLLASSLGVVLTPNLFHAVLYLAAALVATGVVFLLLDSPFLFGVQLLLYAGGVAGPWSRNPATATNTAAATMPPLTTWRLAWVIRSPTRRSVSMIANTTIVTTPPA